MGNVTVCLNRTNGDQSNMSMEYPFIDSRVNADLVICEPTERNELSKCGFRMELQTIPADNRKHLMIKDDDDLCYSLVNSNEKSIFGVTSKKGDDPVVIIRKINYQEEAIPQEYQDKFEFLLSEYSKVEWDSLEVMLHLQ